MKKLIMTMALLAVFATGNLTSQTAHARRQVVAKGDHTIPWPWGAEMPFPWSFVQGIWLAQTDDVRTYFVFRVVREKASGINQLEVKEINPATCEVIARGVGFEQSRILRAQMNSVRGGSVYRITLRAFSADAVNRPISAKPVNGQYVVMSVFPYEATSSSVSIPMTQLSNRLNFKCRGDE